MALCRVPKICVHLILYIMATISFKSNYNIAVSQPVGGGAGPPLFNRIVSF